jgi:cytochrome c oxidase assembly factor CtaG/putative copper export protein
MQRPHADDNGSVQRARWWIVGGAVAALAVSVGVAAAVGGTPYKQLGDLANGNPGAGVAVPLSMFRALADTASCGCVGSLAFAVLFSRPQTIDGDAGQLGGRGYRAVRRAAWFGLAWALTAAAVTVLTALSDAGLRANQVPTLHAWWLLIWVQQESLGWFVTTLAAAVVAVAAWVIHRWRSAAPVGLLAVAALLPPLFGGHSSSEAGHDYATAAIMIHVPAAALWVGVLACVTTSIARADRATPAILARYSRIAWVCWWALLGSGLIDAGVLDPSFSTASEYGRLLATTVGLSAALAVLGMALRRRAIRRAMDGGRAAAVRLCGVELVLLGATVGASAELSQLAPPVFQRTIPVSLQKTLLGYDLDRKPTLARLLFDWRFEVLFTALAFALAATYVVGVVRLRRAGTPWPIGRTAAWLVGCATLVVATSSGLGRYEPASFAVHMACHSLLACVIPLLLVLGGPLTLARTASRPPPAGLPGAAEWIGILDASPLTRFLTHPITALGLFAWSPFAVYFGGIFDLGARFHWAYIGLDLFFLAGGYVFAWTVVGVDPLPRPAPPLVRLGILLVAAPFGAVFAALVMTTHHVLGNSLSAANMYSSLLLSWHPNLLAVQRTGGVVALVIGDVALVAAIAILAARWSRNSDTWWDLVETPPAQTRTAEFGTASVGREERGSEGLQKAATREVKGP